MWLFGQVFQLLAIVAIAYVGMVVFAMIWDSCCDNNKRRR